MIDPARSHRDRKPDQLPIAEAIQDRKELSVGESSLLTRNGPSADRDDVSGSNLLSNTHIRQRSPDLRLLGKPGSEVASYK